MPRALHPGFRLRIICMAPPLLAAPLPVILCCIRTAGTLSLGGMQRAIMRTNPPFPLRALALPASALLAVLLFSATAGQPFHLDNVDFPLAGEAAARTGLPVHYRGEFTPALSGLYHPPLYIYSLGAWFRVFGAGEVQARMLGFVCMLLLGWLWLETGRTLYGREIENSGAWFWPLFLLNPFTLQGASITDIDTTVYGPLLAGVLLVTLRMSWSDGQPRASQPGWREWALLTALMTLSLWAKLTTVWAVLAAACLLSSRRIGLQAAFRRACAAAAASVLLFLLSYALYGALTGLDVWYSVRFTLESFLTRGTTSLGDSGGRLGSYWRNLVFMAPFHVRWTGLLPWVLSACAAAAVLRRALNSGDRRHRSAGVVLMLALGVTVYYCAHTPAYGFAPFKYVYVFWPAVVLSGAVLLQKAWERAGAGSGLIRGRALLACAAALGAVSAGATLIWVGDRLLYENRMLWPQSLALWIPAAAALFALAARLRGSAAPLIVLAAALHAGFCFGVASAQTKAHYSTMYDYGQEGLAETACYLRSHTDPEDRLVCMKDVGYHARRRYYSTYSAIQGVPEFMNRVLRAIAEGKVRYAVFTEGRGQDQLILNPVLKAGVEEMCRLEKSIGHYRIYNCSGLSPGGPPVNARRQ